MAAQGGYQSPLVIAKFHDIGVETIGGNLFPLERYKGKVVLIVNIASYGIDASKAYVQMNEIQSKYSDQVAVLGFPCNQFNHMEPGEGEEILETMKHLRPGNGFSPVFEVLKKVEVNGVKAHPLFKLLRETLPLPGDDLHSFTSCAGDITWAPVCRNDIADNFEKFVVAPNGKPYRRYSSKIQVTNLQNDIQILLEKFQGYKY